MIMTANDGEPNDYIRVLIGINFYSISVYRKRIYRTYNNFRVQLFFHSGNIMKMEFHGVEFVFFSGKSLIHIEQPHTTLLLDWGP